MGQEVYLYADDPDVTLYAKYENETGFALYFYPNAPVGGTVNQSSMPVSPQWTVTDQEEYVFTIATTIPTCSNHFVFKGWADTPDAAEPDYMPSEVIRLYRSGRNVMQLYAVWAPDDFAQYRLILDGNGGNVRYYSGGYRDTTRATSTATAYAELGSIEQYTFTTMSCDANNSRLNLFSRSSPILNGTHYDKGTYREATIEDNSDGTKTRTTYTLLGWSTNSEATVPDEGLDPGFGSYTVTEADAMDADGYYYVTLYAVWQEDVETIYPIYTLNYDANGGTNPPASQTAIDYPPCGDGHDFTVSTDVPTRQQFVFLGWATSANSGLPQYGYINERSSDFFELYNLNREDPLILQNTYTMTQQSETLYAVWMRFYRLNMLNSDDPSILAYSAAIAYTSVDTTSYTWELDRFTPTRDGYIFQGWSHTPNGELITGNLVVTGSTTGWTATTIYAVWEEDPDFEPEGAMLSMSHGPEITGPELAENVAALESVQFEPKLASVDEGTYPETELEPHKDISATESDSKPTSAEEPLQEKDAVLSEDEAEAAVHTLKYHANGGAYAPNWVQVSDEADTHTVVLSRQMPVRDGYIFLGWALRSDAMEPAYGYVYEGNHSWLAEYNSSHPGAPITLESSITLTDTDVTLYAVWTADSNYEPEKAEPELEGTDTTPSPEAEPESDTAAEGESSPSSEQEDVFLPEPDDKPDAMMPEDEIGPPVPSEDGEGGID